MKQSILILLFAFLLSLHANAAVQIAVTVDDLTIHGALPPGETRLNIVKTFLEVLKKHKVPEVYGFLNATKLEEEPSGREQLKQWVAAGYPLGNHTFSHPNLRSISPEKFIEDIKENEKTLREISAKYDWKYFRYPYLNEGDFLEKRNAVRGFLKENGYKIAQVTVDFEDWAWNNPYARCVKNQDNQSIEWLEESYLNNAKEILVRSQIVSEAVFGRPIAHILLLHIGAFDARMLDRLLLMYEGMGATFIPLFEASADPIYSIDPGFTFNRGVEFEYQVLKYQGKSLRDIGLEPINIFPEEKLNAICSGP